MTFNRNDNESLTIYTCCIGGCDYPSDVKSLLILFPKVRFVAFTDTISYNLFTSGGWETFCLSKVISVVNASNRITSRIPKLNPTILNFSTKYALWIDSSIAISEHLVRYVLHNMINTDVLGMFRHYKRKNVLSESIYCLLWGKLSLIQFICAIYQNRYSLLSSNLLMGGIILWNLRSPKSIVVQKMLMQLMTLIGRDQLVFPVLYSRGIVNPFIFDSCYLQEVSIRTHIIYSAHPQDPLTTAIHTIIRASYQIIQRFR
jgi:hypothetical protein